MDWISLAGIAAPGIAAAGIVSLFLLRARKERRHHSSAVIEAGRARDREEEGISDAPSLFASLSDVRVYGASWVRQNWPELLAGVATAAIVLFILLALPRMNPGHPPLPNTPDRPFYGLQWQYKFLLSIVPLAFRIWPIVASLFVVALAVGVGRSDTRRGVRLTWLAASLALAVQAQLAVASQRISVGIWLYLAAFGAMLAWGIAYGASASRSLAPSRKASPAEWFWLTAVLALALLFRMYRLGLYPYGLEGDETKFTYHLVSLVMDGQSNITSDVNLGLLPGHTYMELPFHRLLGPGIFAARASQCFYNLLGVGAFFWLVRQIFRVPVAIVATLLLAVSLLDASSARHGALENFVALWSSISFALFALAVRKRRSGFFALAGLAASLGLLTLDTFIPVAGALTVLFVFELFRRRDETAAQRARHAVGFFAPLAMISVAVGANFARRFSYYGLGSQNWTSDPFATSRRNVADAFSLLFSKLPLQPDFSYNREGPLENSLILPLLVLGLAFGISNFHRSRVGWGALWFLFGFLPIPILIHYALPRVIYPALPSLYFLAGIGIWLLVSQIGEAGPAWRVAARGTLGVGLAFYVGTNAYLAFNMIPERDLVRVARREMYDAVAGNAGRRTVVYLPYVPGAGDLVEFEKSLAVRLAARDAGWRLKSPDGYALHEVVAFDEVLPALLRPDPGRDQAIIVYYRSSQQQAAREEALAKILRCFPGTEKRGSGDYFDVYSIPALAFRQSTCRLAS